MYRVVLDEETIPDGTETMRSTRILAANDDDDKEEGSSSHDEYKVQQPIVPAPVIVTDEAANDGQQIQMMNGGEARTFYKILRMMMALVPL